MGRGWDTGERWEGVRKEEMGKGGNVGEKER